MDSHLGNLVRGVILIALGGLFFALDSSWDPFWQLSGSLLCLIGLAFILEMFQTRTSAGELVPIRIKSSKH